MFLWAVGLQTGNVFLEPWGNFLIGPGWIPLPGSTAPRSFQLGVPISSTVVGLTVYAQALVAPFAAGAPIRFTNLLTLRGY